MQITLDAGHRRNRSSRPAPRRLLLAVYGRDALRGASPLHGGALALMARLRARGSDSDGGDRHPARGTPLPLSGCACPRRSPLDAPDLFGGAPPRIPRNGLQRKLVRIGERRAFADGYREGYATVSPKNKYSLDNMLALGYLVVCEAAKYGSVRLILHKRMYSPTTPSRQAFRFRGATVPCIRDARPPEMPAYGHVPTA